MFISRYTFIIAYNIVLNLVQYLKNIRHVICRAKVAIFKKSNVLPALR